MGSTVIVPVPGYGPSAFTGAVALQKTPKDHVAASGPQVPTAPVEAVANTPTLRPFRRFVPKAPPGATATAAGTNAPPVTA